MTSFSELFADAQARRESGDLAGALALFDGREQDLPLQKGLVYLVRAELFAQLGQPDRAIDSLDAALASGCRYKRSWLEENKRLAPVEGLAEEMVGRALQFDPNNGAYLDTLGWIHYRKGKFEDALNELLRAAQNLTKPDPIVLEHIGDAYAKLNRVPQALDFWQKAIASSRSIYLSTMEAALPMPRLLWPGTCRPT